MRKFNKPHITTSCIRGKKITIAIFGLILISACGWMLVPKASLAVSPTVILTASPASINSGNSTTLAWSSSDASSCTASSASPTNTQWSGSKAVSSSQSITNLTATTTFYLSCTSTDHLITVVKNVTVFVTWVTPPAITSFYASPTSVSSGDSATLTWSVANTTSCSASASPTNTQWSGSKAATSGSHSQSITNLTATTTTNVVFSLVCTGAGGSVTKTVAVTVTPKAPAQPTLLSPFSGSTVPSLTPTLQWNSVPGAGAYIWNVLYFDSGFATNTQATVSSGRLSWGQTYTWRVKACTDSTASASCSDWSSSWSFTTQAAASTPSVPTLIYPTNGATVPSLTPTLDWTDVSGAVAYQYMIGTNWNSGTTTSSQTTIASGILTSYNTTFAWKVRACADTALQNCSAWSSEWYFKTPQAATTSTLPTLTFYASSTSINYGESTTLIWSSVNVSSCTASSTNTQWSGTKTSSGSLSISGLTVATTTFILNCTGVAGGSVAQSVTVTVGTATAPTLTFYASPNPANSGGSTTLIWAPANVVSCSASSTNTQWSGDKVFSGTQSQSISGLTTATTFILVCTGANGVLVTQSVTVGVGTTAVSVCDSTSFTTQNTAFDFGTAGGNTVSNVCGVAQYYKITVPSGQTCTVKWTLQPDSVSDYDLYVRWGTGTLSAKNYDDESTLSKGLKDEVSKANLSTGTYYALVDKPYPNNTPGSYSITASLTNCTTPTTPATCDFLSFAAQATAYDFGSNGGTISNVCGVAQYYKVTVPSGQTCGIKWTLQPDSVSDYDLYVRWGTGALSKSNYDDKAVLSKGLKDEVSKTGLSAGTYYALVNKPYPDKTPGSYSITAILTNCTGLAVTPIPTPTPTTESQVIAQLTAQITQLTAQIVQLQAELVRMLAGQPSAWCYTFKQSLGYKDSGTADVIALQTALQKEGVYPGATDSYYGISTLEAVISFQEKYKTEVLIPWKLTRGTGFAGSTTIKKLNQLYGCK